MASAPKAIFDCDEALRAHSHGPSSYIMAGIVGDTQHSFGYHLAPHELPSDDYSLELARDKAGAKKNRGMASAWDLHFGPADMILVTKRLVAAAKAKDARLAGVREFCGTTNGKNPHPFDLSRGFDDPNNTQEWDDTHLSHVHVSFYRDVCQEFAAIKGLVDVICGTSSTSSARSTEKMYKFVRFSKGVTHTDAVYLSDYMSLRWISDSARLTALQASLKADGFDTTVHAVALPRSVFGVLIGKDPEAK